jgi:hypothetical protein
VQPSRRQVAERPGPDRGATTAVPRLSGELDTREPASPVGGTLELPHRHVRLKFTVVVTPGVRVRVDEALAKPLADAVTVELPLAAPVRIRL